MNTSLHRLICVFAENSTPKSVVPFQRLKELLIHVSIALGLIPNCEKLKEICLSDYLERSSSIFDVCIGFVLTLRVDCFWKHIHADEAAWVASGGMCTQSCLGILWLDTHMTEAEENEAGKTLLVAICSSKFNPILLSLHWFFLAWALEGDKGRGGLSVSPSRWLGESAVSLP